ITPPEKTTQRNNIYALLLDSGNNSNPITGAQVEANITYWTFDGTNYINNTKRIQLTEDLSHTGLYNGSFYFYGGTYYYGYDMAWCDGCHLSYYTSAPDSSIGYFPGNYTAKITAKANSKETISELSFEVTPWGCEDCHGSGDQHRNNLNNQVVADMDSGCYLCHGINQIVHDGTDAGNPHQNPGHRSIQCTDCHTNKRLDPQTFNGVTFITGGINNAPLPQYDFATTQLNSGNHKNLTCTACHNDLMLLTPQGGYKPDNYTINNRINKYNPTFASMQEFQDYYVINVDPAGQLNITLDWEGNANIGFYLYPPNFNPRNRSDPKNPDKGDYPYYNGSNGDIFVKPKYFANNTNMAGQWILEVYGYDLLYWVGTLKPPINYSINSTYPIQQKNLPAIPECNSCHNSNGAGKAFTNDQIPDWNPGFAHVDINNDGNLDVQCRMCHNAMHDITVKACLNCHTTAPTGHPISEPAFSQYTQSQCLACHGDPHKVTMAGGGCIGCHSNPDTRYYVNTSLFAGHANVNESGGPNNVTDADCMTCHFGSSDIIMSPDAGLGAANHNNTWFCDDCHTEGGSGPLKSTILKSVSHGSTDCKWCHIAGDPLQRPLINENETLRYHPNGPKGTAAGQNCLTCHVSGNLPDLPFHAPGESHSTTTTDDCSEFCHQNSDPHRVTPLNVGTLPTISGLTVTTPVTSGTPALVQATINDDYMQIAAAQYRVTDASGEIIPWTNMTPAGGRFSLSTQGVSSNIITSNLKGTYTVYVKGMASAYKTNPSIPYYPMNGQWSSGVYSAQFKVEEPEGYGNGTVYGILDQKIAGAIVSTNTSVSTTTDQNGAYSLSLPNGTYQLTASKEPEYYPNSSVIVTVTAYTTVNRDIILTSRPTGNISGTVRVK
ncbi:MAG: carboxypeptidase regulatory-like domain-containing protein, partial [Candidatus Methanoperedens sp.]